MKYPRFITRNRILVFIGCLAAASIVFVAGGVWGFNKGHAAGLYSPADASYTVQILRSIRSGWEDQAIKLLETRLDGQIVGVGMFEPMYRSRLNLVGYTRLGEHADRAGVQLMADVAKYREEHSPLHSDEAVREVIRSTLERYAEEAKHNPGAERSPDN
jgi:hypothetical protein